MANRWTQQQNIITPLRQRGEGWIVSSFKEIVRALDRLAPEEREKTMAAVGKMFCLRCWSPLNEGDKCYCDPSYDV